MTGDASGLLLFACRTGLNVAALLVIGLSLHGALGVVKRSGLTRLRRGLAAACVGLLLFALARFLLLAADIGGLPAFTDPDLLALTWTALGASTTALGISVSSAALAVAFRNRLWLLVAALSAAAGFGLTGHSQGLSEPGLAPAGVMLHVLIAGFWVAAPLTLWPRVTTSDPDLVQRLKRFSLIAIAAIPVMVVVGTALAWQLAGGWQGLTGQLYGWLLLGKLGVALAAMLLGAANQRLVTAEVERRPESGRRWLRVTLAAETTLFGAAILAVSAATSVGAPV